MTNKEFDDIIKKKLSGIENTSKPDWNIFNKKLEHQKLADEHFDQQLANKLKDIKKPVKPSHWELLRKRLVREEYVRSRLYTLKSVESFSLLLLLLILMNNQYVKFDFSKYADPALYAELFNRNEVLPERINNQLTYNSSKYKPKKNNQAAKDIQTPIDFEVSTYMNRSAVLTVPVLISKISPLENEGNKKGNLLSELTEEILLHTQGNRTPTEPITSLEEIQVSAINPIHSRPYVDTRLIYNPHLYSKGKTYYDVSIYANNGLLQVKSPYDHFYQTEANTRYGTMSRLGILIGAGTEKFKIKTGLEYSFQNYKPLKVEEIFGSLAGGVKKYSLDAIRFDAITLPVRLSFTLYKGEKSKINFITGLNTNLLANSSYKIIEQELSREESLVYTDLSRIGQRSVKQEPILHQKHYPKGLLNGGGLSTIFFDTTTEIEYERKITENKSVQFALGAMISANNRGIGPNDDALNGLYARIGLNYKLN